MEAGRALADRHALDAHGLSAGVEPPVGAEIGTVRSNVMLAMISSSGVAHFDMLIGPTFSVSSSGFSAALAEGAVIIVLSGVGLALLEGPPAQLSG